MEESSATNNLPVEGLNLTLFLKQIEDKLVLQALARTGWNKASAARLLGLNRSTLVEKVRKLGIPLYKNQKTGASWLGRSRSEYRAAMASGVYPSQRTENIKALPWEVAKKKRKHGKDQRVPPAGD